MQASSFQQVANWWYMVSELLRLSSTKRARQSETTQVASNCHIFSFNHIVLLRSHRHKHAHTQKKKRVPLAIEAQRVDGMLTFFFAPRARRTFRSAGSKSKWAECSTETVQVQRKTFAYKTRSNNGRYYYYYYILAFNHIN